MMNNLKLKDALKVTVHLQEFIYLKLNKEEGNIALMKDDHYFHQRQIFTKMANPLLILLMMANSNHPLLDNLRFMVIMVDDNTRMSMPELNDED